MADEYEAGTELDAESVAFAERELAAAGNRKPREAAPVEVDDDDPPVVEAAEGEEPGEGDEEPKLNEKQELALKMGWAPRDQWRGAPDAWVDAEAFIERASPRMLLERIDKLTKEHDQTFQRVEKANRAIFDRQKKEHEAHIADLKRQRAVNVAREAVANGEEAAIELGEKWDAHIDAEAAKPIEAAEPAPAKDAPPQQQQIPPETAAWAARHPEYKSDPEFGSASFWAMDKINKEMAGQPLAAQFAELDKRMAKRFPEYYPQAKTPSPPPPPAGVRTMDGVRVAPKQGTNYAAKLPPSARRIAENMVKRGEIKSVEEYAKVYVTND
jgi:hypothetical protein